MKDGQKKERGRDNNYNKAKVVLVMAISSYPTPADAGVLCIILANAAISISIFKEIVRSVLHVIGIHVAPWEGFSVEPSDESSKCRKSPSETYMEEFRNRTSAIFICDSCPEQECSICLMELGPNTEINCLSCGHIFHKLCLEKWLKYWNTTCPLCRDCMIAQEMEECECPM
ncbi:probable E3 ubiquitin-protein ligase XERICO [Primulina huaijiensis]|uniref:probable E3 ubiquitin-protein ligase XERICO n=1 Tax=Primulina huaijiensis TaxID=1492673 RepID=UPI003CC75248